MLFEGVAAYLREQLGCAVSLSHESRFSGPPRGSSDPFSSAAVDAAFMCAPPFFWLLERRVPVELLGVAPLFDDPRCARQPVYFADVVTRAGGAANTFLDLRGGTWAYNDPCSLSGYYCLLQHLADTGEENFFTRLVCSGSHDTSLEWVAADRVSAAAIDSNVLRLRLAAEPRLSKRLKTLVTWGPFPVQPLVVRSGLDVELKGALRTTLLALGDVLPPALAASGCVGFAPVTLEHYRPEVEALQRCQNPLGTTPFEGEARVLDSARL